MQDTKKSAGNLHLCETAVRKNGRDADSGQGRDICKRKAFMPINIQGDAYIVYNHEGVQEFLQ